jgi:hypothetical protein
MRKIGPEPGMGSKRQEKAYGDSMPPVAEDTGAAAAAAAAVAAAEKATAHSLEAGKTCLLDVLDAQIVGPKSQGR